MRVVKNNNNNNNNLKKTSIELWMKEKWMIKYAHPMSI
jgi:hypothetical protein